jgi:hypothetical protein
MSSFAISSIVFAFVFGGALFGLFLRRVLPEHHLTPDSKEVVRLAMGLVATMSALVLSLLISSANHSYDAQSVELTEASAKIILLDRTLARFGSETKEARDLVRSFAIGILDRMWPEDHPSSAQAEAPTSGADPLYDTIEALVAKDDKQRAIQAQAMSILAGLRQTRWLMYEQRSTSISMPFFIILLSWLTPLFISFGLFARPNGTVITSLLVSALSVSGAILLILELYSPYTGLLKISSAPVRAALMHLGK